MSDEWISAAEAFRLVTLAGKPYDASRAICTRAHAGLIKARAARLLIGDQSIDDANVPQAFWWAHGEAALKQNWRTGDFETWIERTRHLRAFGVTFHHADIQAMIAPALADREPAATPPPTAAGRPRAEFWDDMLIEIFRQLWENDLKPTRQSEIEAAMNDWAAANGHNPSDSTIRPRASKLWKVLFKGGKN